MVRRAEKGWEGRVVVRRAAGEVRRAYAEVSRTCPLVASVASCMPFVGTSKMTLRGMARGKREVGSRGHARKEMTDGLSVKRQRMIRLERSLSLSER